MKLSKLNIFLIFVLALSIGVLINDFPYLTFKKDLSLGEIANFVLALFIAIYIPFFLDKKINTKRIEKDILIEECNNINKELYDLKKLIEAPYITRKIIKKDLAATILLRTRSISNMLNLLRSNTADYRTNKEIKSIMDQLIINNSSYWSDMTLILKDRSPRFTPELYLKTEKNFNEYSGNISKLKMYINGA